MYIIIITDHALTLTDIIANRDSSSAQVAGMFVE